MPVKHFLRNLVDVVLGGSHEVPQHVVRQADAHSRRGAVVRAVPEVAVVDQQGTGLALERDRLLVAAITRLFRHDLFFAMRLSAPLVAARHDCRRTVLAGVVGQPVGRLAADGMWRQR